MRERWKKYWERAKKRKDLAQHVAENIDLTNSLSDSDLRVFNINSDTRRSGLSTAVDLSMFSQEPIRYSQNHPDGTITSDPAYRKLKELETEFDELHESYKAFEEHKDDPYYASRLFFRIDLDNITTLIDDIHKRKMNQKTYESILQDKCEEIEEARNYLDEKRNELHKRKLIEATANAYKEKNKAPFVHDSYYYHGHGRAEAASKDIREGWTRLHQWAIGLIEETEGVLKREGLFDEKDKEIINDYIRNEIVKIPKEYDMPKGYKGGIY